MVAHQRIRDISKKVLIIGGIVGVLSSCSNSRQEKLKKLEQELELLERFNTAYHSALSRYADKDGDGFVTSTERDAFDKELLKDKKVTLVVENMPRYLDGTKVPTETVIDWIQNYSHSE